MIFPSQYEHAFVGHLRLKYPFVPGHPDPSELSMYALFKAIQSAFTEEEPIDAEKIDLVLLILFLASQGQKSWQSFSPDSKTISAWFPLLAGQNGLCLADRRWARMSAKAVSAFPFNRQFEPKRAAFAYPL